MNRTHTETVEYFEHDGDRYRRFADGTWQVQVSNGGWSEHFCDSTQLEAIYQQPDRCKSCKYYDNNPYLHCAVHPSGSDGVCGDWEESPKVVRDEGTGFNWSMPDSIPAPFRNISHVSVRRRYSAGNHDGAEDGLDDSADLQRTIRQMQPYDSPLRPYDSPLREIPSYYFEAVELRNSRTEFRFTAGRLTEVQEYVYFNPITNSSFRSFRSSLIRPRSQDTQEHDNAELAFLQSCDRIIVRPEHVGIVFCKGLCDGQTLLVDDIIYFNSSQSAIAIERNGQLIWRSSE